MKGFVKDIESIAVKNEEFRQVLYTAKNCQLVVMARKLQEEIGTEVHTLDQFFRVEAGTGEAILDGARTAIQAGSAIVVPAGAKHNIVNTGSVPLKLYTIYAPPNSPGRHRPPYPRGRGSGQRTLRRQDDGMTF
jgi:mannose-6-phosphate isomerase-like protein (cupin superfamily)